MDAKDLRIESAPSDHNNDGSKYAQSGSVLQCNRNKSYQDIGSNSLVKVDVPSARPCAVIGPDRVIPPAVSNDAFIKKASVEPWPCSEHMYRRPPEYPHRMSHYQNPTRNISPRQTFQENMPRIMVPPTFSTVKTNDDPNFAHGPDRNGSLSKNTKLNLLPEAKYCDVPYNVNPLTNDQKISRNAEISVSSVNPVISRNAPHGWPPGSVNLRPSRVYGAPELYQYPEYPSCAGPRSVPISRPHRTVQDDAAGYVYSDPYYHEANIRFKPYPIPKDIQRYPQPRYEYVGNYSNPFHPPPPFPPYKYELQKPIHPHPYQGYPHLKYLEGRISDPLMEGYQRSPNQQANYNLAYRNQIIHPPYGPVLGNSPQNKMHPYATDGSVKSIASNKLPYENNNKMYLEHENARNKAYPSVPDNFYLNDMSRIHPIRSQVIMANYPSVNMHSMHPYYKKENSQLKNYEYFKSIDPSMTINNSLLRYPSRFSPSAVAISPSDSNTSIDTLQTQSTLQEDCGYISQSSTASIRSIDNGINQIPNDYYKKYDYRYGPVIRHPSISKPEVNHNRNTGSKTKKNIDVRQFFQMWNEGEDDNNENCKDNVQAGSNDKNIASKQHEANNQEQLYVLGLVNVPSEELGKYEHIQQVSKLPENIKGYSSIELLNQFEDAIESSNISCHKPPTPREFSMLGKVAMTRQTTDIMHRPLSPLDVEAKISQSIIHKEVGCNFEIKPCSPKMLNVEIAAPVHNILGERLIEKVANPLRIRSPIINGDKNMDSYNNIQRQDHRLNINEKVPSCKMANTQFSTDHSMNTLKTNYSFNDLESNSGVCLASLPRLDNDIELSFPEVNQQFINANKGESTVSSKDLPALEPTIEMEKSNSNDNAIKECDIVQQLSPMLDTEKKFVKLSKYRKSKPSSTDFKEEDSHLTSKVVRTNSVIIKNPDNIKSYDDSIVCTTQNNVPFENQQTAINLSSQCNVMNRVEDELNFDLTATDNSNGHNDIPNDVAIDFSLNKQANNFLNSYVETHKNEETAEQKNETCKNFENKLTKTINENFDDEFRKTSNTINNIIITCEDNEIKPINYIDIVKEDKYLAEKDIDMVELITNSEKCVLAATSPFIETPDNEEQPNSDNIEYDMSLNSPNNLPLKATMNADNLFQNSNDLECTTNSMMIVNDEIQNNSSDVLAESEIDIAINSNKEDKDSSVFKNQDLIEKKLYDVKAGGLFQITNSMIVENGEIENNLSGVDEREIDQTITSHKEDLSETETSEIMEKNLFNINVDTSHKSNNDQEDTKSLTMPQSGVIQNNIPAVLAKNDETITTNKKENEIDHTFTSKKKESEINQTMSNKEDSSLFENLGVIENTTFSKNSASDESCLEKAKTVNVALCKTDEKDINNQEFRNQSNQFSSKMQIKLLDVGAESKNYMKDESKPYIETITSDHTQRVIPARHGPSEIVCSEEAKSSSKPIETLCVSNQHLIWNEQSKSLAIQNIEVTNDIQVDSNCEDSYEGEHKSILVSKTYSSKPELLLARNYASKNKEAKCSKALYSPWIQKLILHHEGRSCDKLNKVSNFGIEHILEKPRSTTLNSKYNIDAVNIPNDSSSIGTNVKESPTNPELKSFNYCSLQNEECLLKDTTLPDMNDVLFNDLNDFGCNEIHPDESTLSKSSDQTHELKCEISKSEKDLFQSDNDNFSSQQNGDDIDYHHKLGTDTASILQVVGNNDMNTNSSNDIIPESESQYLFQPIQNKYELSNTTLTDEKSDIKNITVLHNDSTDSINKKFGLEGVKETHEFLSKNRLSLKRSLSDSAINVYKNECSQDSDNNALKWRYKRKKVCNVNGRVEADLIAENVCKILQNNRRNSISSSIYNEENVSICIFIDNNCIITEDNEGEEKVCYTELPDDCLPESNSDSVNEEHNTDFSTEDISCFEEKSCEFIPFNQLINSPILECGEGGKDFEETWVDDVACVETVVSDDIAEDIEISAPLTPLIHHSDTDSSDNDESGFFGNNISDHTDKVKYIYGDKMCSDDAQLVEKLYRTPQMNVNKTLINKEFHLNEEYTKYYDKESLEKILSDSNSQLGSPCTSFQNDSIFLYDKPIKTPDDKENVDIGNLSPSQNKNNYERENDIDSERRDKDNVYSNTIHEKMQDVTVHSCESSIDNVFTYKQRDETNSFTSSSPEVSSTTSEERNSSILLKITNYKGSIISQINDVKPENIKKSNCKYTEERDFVNSCPNLPTNRPLITKAAQKYIPPLKESIRDLKVKLSLPQHSLIKLKHMKISKDKPKLNKHVTVPKTSKKPKPKFEDVLKSIDEIQFKMHKEKSKKLKKSIPKVVIKKTQNGSHYASTSNKDLFNPDLTGRKWQPWVFLEKNTFIDKMAIKKNSRAIYSHRKNTYVLAEKFRKYKSVSSTKFVISKPKLEDSSSGHLKYTIRLKHTY